MNDAREEWWMQKCAKCGKQVVYPDGVYNKKGRILHVACVRPAKQRKEEEQ